MRATIDKAGRLVIPKPLRDEVGIEPGEVEIVVDGAALRLEPVTDERIEEQDGFLVVVTPGLVIDDSDVARLRRAGQR